MNQIKKLLIKYKELIIYGVFGLMTTVVNFVVFAAADFIIGSENYLVSNVIAWLAAIIFAYITNKIWVFESRIWKTGVLLKEVSAFFSSRVFSFLIEESGLYLLVDVLDLKSLSFDLFGFTVGGSLIAKGIIGVIVVIINYLFSKLFIFKKKKD